MKARLRAVVGSRWFYLAELLFVAASGASWMFIPKFGIWFTLPTLLCPIVRWLSRGRPFQRTPFDWLIAIFLFTAWIAYWAAYDPNAAWIKIWLIVTSVLLYYAISAQPKENLEWFSAASFCLAVGLSLYWFLSHDFAGSQAAIALWWMKNRPQVGWPAIHNGYLSGLLVLLSLIGSYWLTGIGRESGDHTSFVRRLLLGAGIAIISLTFLLTTSRGLPAVVLEFWSFR